MLKTRKAKYICTGDLIAITKTTPGFTHALKFERVISISKYNKDKVSIKTENEELVVDENDTMALFDSEIIDINL